MKPSIIKSPADRRSFRYCDLPNGLKALLVSDPQTSMSAASLSVAIGSDYNDSVLGLAHFLEHMLFMGSGKYPNENEYATCIKNNGGTSNAYTSNDHTNFYFECNTNSLGTVLDVFAQFFIDPLFKPDSVQREMLAVDSEYKNALMSDGHRSCAVIKKFMIGTHPNSKFSCGNISTLNIPNIRDLVVEFYHKYYSADRMAIIIVGTETLDELESTVNKMFGLVPKKDIDIPPIPNQWFNAPVYGQMVPLKNIHTLGMNWEFDLDSADIASHLDDFIAYVLGNEGSGSLFSVLDKKFLVKYLRAGVSKESKSHILFEINVGLSDLGFEQIDLVKKIILEYIQMFSSSTLKDISALYDEYVQSQKLAFENYTVPDALSFAKSKSVTIATKPNIPITNIIANNSLFDEFTPDTYNAISSILSKMTMANVILFEQSKKFESDSMEIEPWFNVKYRSLKFSEFSKVPTNSDYKLTLPLINIYTCDTIRQLDLSAKTPQLLPIANTEIWWMPYTENSTTKVCFRFELILPNMHDTLKNQMVSRLLFNCLNHSINAVTYDMQNAHYGVSISKSNNKLSINVNGYMQKFALVLDFIVESILNLKSTITVDLFDHIKSLYRIQIENWIYMAPHQMITDELLEEIGLSYRIDEAMPMLDTITLADLIAYELLDGTIPNKSVGLIQGAITYPEAVDLGKIIHKLGILNNLYELVPRVKHTDSYEFTKPIRNKSDLNSCYKLAIRIGYMEPKLNPMYIEELSILVILSDIIHERYFDQLRTKEQLGYVVRAHFNSYGTDIGYLTIDFCVQSPNTNCSDLKDRTMKFIGEFRDFLFNESDPNIQQVIDSSITLLESPDQNLYDSVGKNFSLIKAYGANFNMIFDRVKYLRTITKTHLVEFYDKFFTLDPHTYWSMMLQK